jgi:organic radical activating enzyme
MFLKTKNGIVFTKKLEINVVHHCNLVCRGCSHLSPHLPKYFISPDKLQFELSDLSRSCRPESVHLIGGEPLLHPNLDKIIEVVRNSGITKKIRIVTNGLLLPKMKDSFWESIEELHVSLYPVHQMKKKDLYVFKQQAKISATNFVLRYQDYFNESFLKVCNNDDTLVRRIYRTCSLPNKACCHTLFDGYYYKCPRSIFIPLAYKDRYIGDVVQNGIRILGNKRFAFDLVDYLSSDDPLEACRYCLGSVGKRFKPEQIKKQKLALDFPPEKLIDYKKLEKLENNKGIPLPHFIRSLWQTIHNKAMELPAAALLSSSLRRAYTALSELNRRYMK